MIKDAKQLSSAMDEDDEESNDEDESEETRLSHRRVASRYLHSRDGLLLDVLCRWPWDAFVAAAAGVQLSTLPSTLAAPPPAPLL